MMDYRREVDGLRALAVIPVIFFHAGFSLFSGGYVGVDVFFVISGYLITGIVMNEVQQGTFSIVDFYERRIRRILPALFLVVACCVPAAYVILLPSDMKEFSQSLIAVATFSSNVLFWSQSGYFEGAAELKPLLHTWSLSVEEQFYLFFPVFLLLTWRLGKKWVIALLFAATLISLGSAEWGALNKPIAAFFLLPTRAWELLLGSLVAFYLDRISNKPLPVALNSVLATSGFLAIAYAIFGFNTQTTFPGLHALVPTIGAALLIIGARPETLVGRLLCLPAMVSVGLISYSTYLWHQPLFAFARHLGLSHSNALALGAIALLSVAMGYISWKYIETPIRRNKNISRRVVFLSAGVGSLLMLVAGVYVHMMNGFIDRLNPADQYLASISYSAQGEYVRRRFDERQHASFSDSDQRLKVLVIGDSFAKDLVNAIHEGPLADKVQVSTHQISVGCGNLYLDRSIESYVLNPQPVLCRQDDWYNSPRLKELIRQSDSVWIASAWQSWDVALLPESINRLRNEFGNKFLVFGTKNFGSIDIKNLISTPIQSRYQMQNKISEASLNLNMEISKIVGASNFVNLSELMCGDSGYCSVFTPDARLMSYDGGHLTADGAKLLAERLAKKSLVLNHTSQ